jgi:hypothetical protein
MGRLVLLPGVWLAPLTRLFPAALLPLDFKPLLTFLLALLPSFSGSVVTNSSPTNNTAA